MLSQEIAWLLEEKYHGQKTEGFLADVTRLKDGEPLAYLIGSIPFLGTTITLDSRPLIPRTETEYWTNVLIEEIKKREVLPLHVLDMCAGSGCIGVALAATLPHARVDFVELETEHISTIKKNCHLNGINPDRYHIYSGDLFSSLSQEHIHHFDYIVSNPPYIDPVLDRTESSVRIFEPANALYGGMRGMEILVKLIEEAPLYLKPLGELWLEHEPEQAAEITTLASSRFAVTTQKDQYGIARFSKLVLQ